MTFFLPFQLNSTYTCFVDPTDVQRRPLKQKQDVIMACDDVIFYLCLPGIVVALGTILILAVLVPVGLEFIFKMRPRCLFRVRTHPIIAFHNG